MHNGVLSDECSNGIFWEHYDDGTLFMWGQVEKDDGFGFYSESVFGYARFYKRKTDLKIVQDVKYKVKCGNQPCETSVPQDWFRWAFEDVE